MNNRIFIIALGAISIFAMLPWTSHLLAATSGVLAVSVTVAEKCRIDFSEGSADFFQVCSAAPGVANERSSNVLGSAIAVDPASDPYYLDRNPDNPSQEASAGRANSTTAAAERRGPKIVHINY